MKLNINMYEIIIGIEMISINVSSFLSYRYIHRFELKLNKIERIRLRQLLKII